MDEYTRKTRLWLEERFARVDDEGIYFAHQPVYGFRKGHCDAGHISKYILTYRIMRALSHLHFDSLLDVGAAEGYKAHVARTIFNINVESCDISKEACDRAREIFGIESTPADIHELPFRDNEFDVVLCSETLEHVTDPRKALAELIRLAAKAILITVPHDPKSAVDMTVKEGTPHGHIQRFELDSFDFLEAEGHRVLSQRMFSRLLGIPVRYLELMPKELGSSKGLPKIATDIYNRVLPVTRIIFGKSAIASLLELDDFVCRFAPVYHAMLFVILKDQTAWAKKPKSGVSACDIMDILVPYYYLRQKGIDGNKAKG